MKIPSLKCKRRHFKYCTGCFFHAITMNWGLRISCFKKLMENKIIIKVLDMTIFFQLLNPNNRFAFLFSKLLWWCQWAIELYSRTRSVKFVNKSFIFLIKSIDSLKRFNSVNDSFTNLTILLLSWTFMNASLRMSSEELEYSRRYFYGVLVGCNCIDKSSVHTFLCSSKEIISERFSTTCRWVFGWTVPLRLKQNHLKCLPLPQPFRTPPTFSR